ncbi:MAG TPA: isoprenylcysteine carboxylmethyltransferase family protein [Myxococcota bacterium]|nr:isoprenylcysteine carboxylmethyltransferase family protein [Myxococcota bacterium]
MGVLLAQSISGLAFLLAVLAFVTCACAGTLGYWQAWAYLAVFGGASALIAAYLMAYDRGLLARRIHGGPIAEAQRGQQVIQALAALFFLATFAAAGLDRRFGGSHVSARASLAADAVVALGFGVVFLTFRANSYAGSTVEVSRGQQVVSTGPYAFVRHPLYAGAALMMLATPPALGSWLALPAPIALVAVVAVRLVEEERFLAMELAGYEDYRRRVPYRLVPFVW